MTEKEQVEFIIQHLGFNGATHTLRVSKARLLYFTKGEQPFTVNVKRYATRTVKSIQDIINCKYATREVEDLFISKNGALPCLTVKQ